MVLAEAVLKLTALPHDAQRQIGMALLSGEVDVALPVIEFADPALDR